MSTRNPNRPFALLNREVQPGERETISIPLAPLVTRDNLAMSVNVVSGKKAGPVLLVTAAIHGDEINGVEIIRRLLRHPSMAGLRGVLLAIPVVNVHGFLHQTRYLPDGRDLNRSFPGSNKGSLSSRVAHKLTELILARSDYAIDLHTGARHRANLPQLRVDLGNQKSRELARAFGTPVVLHSRLRDGSLREEAANRKIPFLLFEGGESLRFDEFSIRVGVRGIINVMRHLGMLRASARRSMTQEPLMTHRSLWIRAPSSGVLRSLVKLGSRVSDGDLLAIVGDPMGNEETALFATDDGIVIGKQNLPLVSEGDAVFHIASYRDLADEAQQAIADLQEEVGLAMEPGII